jgi:heptosyltransferase II
MKSPDSLYSNILIRVPNWLGDTMMATSAVSAVRTIFPKAKLSILAKPVYSAFWKDFPGVDGVVSLEKGFSGFWGTVGRLKQKKFDAALILPMSFSSAFLTAAANIPVRIGWGGEGRDFFLTHALGNPQPRQKHLVWEYLVLVQKGLEKPIKKGLISLHCPLSKQTEKGLQQVWRDAGLSNKKNYIALAPGATYGEAKRWPLPHWKELVQKLLAERQESFLILGGMEDEAYLKPLLELADKKNRDRLHLLAGRTSPTVLAAMLERCKLLVTNDTGPMHVAAAVGTPTVALFGSTSPTWTRPFGISHEVIYKHLECSPCFQKTCPIGYKCLHAISVQEVFESVKRKLRRPGRVKGEPLPKTFSG